MVRDPLDALCRKPSLNVIGLMSGTSVDGIDAVLVEISGCGLSTHVRTLGFTSVQYSSEVRQRLLALAGGDVGGSRELCLMNFLLGQLSADACREVLRQGGLTAPDLIGSHGHTFYHIPRPENYLGHSLTATMQLGEPSLLNEAFSCPVISDFRVRDMACGGQGAPLVPYTEFLLYRSETETTALQNVGGIGNITLLPKGGCLDDVAAFDTGPGNMVMDALAARLTDGRLRYDDGGVLAKQGRINDALLALMMSDDYLTMTPPKSTGRERYGKAYVDWLCRESEVLGASLLDTLATATRFTAEAVHIGIKRFCSAYPDRLIVGGGGSRNPVLMSWFERLLPDIRILTNEDLGYNSDAKEAIAFAVLANECVHGVPCNAPAATGANHACVLGKISL